jgi:hypothetical protein
MTAVEFTGSVGSRAASLLFDEADRLAGAERWHRPTVPLIRHVMIADLCHRFGPGEGGTLACDVMEYLRPDRLTLV